MTIFYKTYTRLGRQLLRFAFNNKAFSVISRRNLDIYKRIFFWKARFFHRNTIECNYKLLFAITAGFSFKEHGVSDEQLKNAEEAEKELEFIHEAIQDWEILVEEPDFRALRRKLKGPGELYEYKCAGTYYDISPESFLDAQNNLSYRSEWDGNIVTLELLCENDEQELLRWISKFPYPMNAREYIYVRRTWVSDDERLVVVQSTAIPEEIIPSLADTSNVRVATYRSRMVIRAHGDWNEHGLDYVLTYSDNPEANIPRYVYNWIVNQGGPYFLKQVHMAAVQLEVSERVIPSVMKKFRLRSLKIKEQESEDEKQ